MEATLTDASLKLLTARTCPSSLVDEIKALVNEQVFTAIVDGKWHHPGVQQVIAKLEASTIPVLNAMVRPFVFKPEHEEYALKVQLHNQEIQPKLLKVLEWISKLLDGHHCEVKDMGSRGFTWKTPTNYLDSDFELAVITEQNNHGSLADLLVKLIKQDHPTLNVELKKTLAGLVYIEIHDFDYGGWINKLEIAFQTPEQNKAICDNYLRHLAVVGPERIKWYSYTMNEVKSDPKVYNQMKTWLRVLKAK